MLAGTIDRSAILAFSFDVYDFDRHSNSWCVNIHVLGLIAARILLLFHVFLEVAALVLDQLTLFDELRAEL